MRTTTLLIVALLGMGACKDAPAEEKESSVHWSYPEPPIVERSVLDEKLDRKEIFMLFTLDGQVQDTLWFKSQDKNRWASLLTVEALQSPKGAEKLTFSLPGEEAHVEFHWHNFEVGERVSMNFSDSVYPADYFRIVDRRENVHEASSQARLYMAEQVKTEVHGVKLYPISEEDQRLSGHISMEFSGTFRERGNDTRHLIEGYIGAW